MLRLLERMRLGSVRRAIQVLDTAKTSYPYGKESGMSILDDIFGDAKAARLCVERQAGTAHDHDAVRRQAEAFAWRPEDYASYRPRKHVDSIVIEPKQLPGEST